jgi:putative OmpL-like beta-barrel porin-2
LLTAPGFAQAPAPVAPAPAPVPPVVAPAPTPAPPAVEPPPSEATAPAAAAPEVAAPPAAALPELPAPAAEAATYAEQTPPAADEDWYDAFDVRVFADAYYGLNYNFPKPQVGGQDVIRAYDSANGFALAWAGLDISHAADPVGGTLALRFGPSARRYNTSCFSGKCDADYGLENVKQAFASWRPGGEGSPVTIDFGKFDTIYGAEVAESQDNINYTRGVLYWLGQPLFHTGLRVNADIGQNLSLRALAVNGWNNTIDNNSGKTFGLQATVHAPRGDGHDIVAASLGYLGGPERDDYTVTTCAAGMQFDAASATCVAGSGDVNGTIGQASSNSKGWRHFLDLVVTSDPIEALHVVLNADYGTEQVRNVTDSTHFGAQQWWGAMLGARYLLSHAFAVGGRGEYYHDDDGLTTGSVFQDRAAEAGLRAIHGTTIFTGTVTLDYLPTKNLMLRLDNRVDHADKQIFPKGLRELTGTLVTTTLGVVVSTN